jgi:CubicO group peptidase (beta-lactamase class C family)
MDDSMNEAIGAVLEEAAATGAVPGAVAVLVDRDGTRALAAAGSTRSDGEGDVLRTDARFRIASMTKALASVAALQLIEQGRLHLDDEVGSVLPAWNDLQVLDGWDGDVPRLRAPKTPATIRHLLTHTAGHGYWFISPDLTRYHEVTGTPNVLSGMRTSLATPLQSDPGTRWEYGINSDWLGLVVEAVSGQSLDAYLADHLFTPLGMKNTSFVATPEERAGMMRVHARTPDGGLAVTDVDWVPEPEWMPGGHGSFSTAEDYGIFITMLLRGGTSPDGTRVLDEDTVELAFSDHLGGLEYPAVIESCAPDLINTVQNLPVRQTWGLGFHLTLEDLEGMRRAGTGDWCGIFNSYFWVDRVAGIGGAFLTQVLPFFDEGCVQAAVGVEQAAYAGSVG